jgi:hypothetical protein
LVWPHQVLNAARFLRVLPHLNNAPGNFQDILGFFTAALQLADFHAHEIHFHFVPSVFTISSNIAVGNRELLFV